MRVSLSGTALDPSRHQRDLFPQPVVRAILVISWCVLVGTFAAAGLIVGAVAVAALPAIAVTGRLLLRSDGGVLVLLPFAFGLSTIAALRNPLPLATGIKIYPTDIVVLLALAHWMLRCPASRSGDAAPWPRALWLSMIGVFAAGMCIGVVRGHDAFGTNLAGQPTRIMAYALIGLIVIRQRPVRLERGLTLVLYAGSAWQAAVGTVDLVTGGHQTGALALSTGGERILALSTALFLAGALLWAVLSLALGSTGRRAQLDYLICTLSSYGLLLAFSRTLFIALAVLLPWIFILSGRLRERAVIAVCFLVPALALTLTIPSVQSLPVVHTAIERVDNTNSQDINVQYRTKASAATLAGLSRRPVLGFGFGHPASFTINGTVYHLEGDDPHNSFVYILAGGGLLALSGLVGLIYLFVGRWLTWLRSPMARGRPIALWAGGFLILFVAQAATEPALAMPVLGLTMWTVLFLPLMRLTPVGGLSTYPSGRRFCVRN